MWPFFFHWSASARTCSTGKCLFINSQTRPLHANEGNQATRKGTGSNPTSLRVESLCCRGRGREGERGRDRQSEGERGRARVRDIESERARERESERARESERESERDSEKERKSASEREKERDLHEVDGAVLHAPAQQRNLPHPRAFISHSRLTFISHSLFKSHFHIPTLTSCRIHGLRHFQKSHSRSTICHTHEITQPAG